MISMGSVGGHVPGRHLVSTVNRAAVNTGGQIPPSDPLSSPWDKDAEVGLLGHLVLPLFIVEEPPSCLPRQLHRCAIPPRVPISPRSSPHRSFPVFPRARPNGCEAVPACGFRLHLFTIGDVEHLCPCWQAVCTGLWGNVHSASVLVFHGALGEAAEGKASRGKLEGTNEARQVERRRALSSPVLGGPVRCFQDGPSGVLWAMGPSRASKPRPRDHLFRCGKAKGPGPTLLS